MKRLCTVLIVLSIVVVGIGFYRGWFILSSKGSSASRQVNVNLTVDQGKMKEDGARLKEKTKELTGQTKD